VVILGLTAMSASIVDTSVDEPGYEKEEWGDEE